MFVIVINLKKVVKLCLAGFFNKPPDQGKMNFNRLSEYT